MDPAIVTLARAMAEPDAPWPSRVKAAEAVLNRAGYPARTEVDVTAAKERLLERLMERRQDGQ